MKTTAIQRMTLTALFAAIICLSTAYLFHITIPATGGYIHLGDAFIYFAACFLPLPYAAVAAAVGSGLADLLSGAPQWIVFTVVIKAAMVLGFTCKKETILCFRNGAATLLAGVTCIVGYYLAEVVLYGNWLTPMTSIGGGLIQSGAAMVLFLIGGAVMDKAQVKKRLHHSGLT